MKIRGLPVVAEYTPAQLDKQLRNNIRRQFFNHDPNWTKPVSKKDFEARVAEVKKDHAAFLKRSNSIEMLSAIKSHLHSMPPGIANDDKKLLALRKKWKTQVVKCKGIRRKKCPDCDSKRLTTWASFKKEYLLCPQCGWTTRPINPSSAHLEAQI